MDSLDMHAQTARNGLQYLEVGATDLDESAEFYRALLGFEPSGPVTPNAGGRRARWLTSGSAALRLVETGADGDLGDWRNDDLQRGVRHFGFKVADVDAAVATLRRAGVQVLSEPADVLGEVRIAFFLDPSGARLEFIQGNLAYQHVYSESAVSADAAARVDPSSRRFDHVAVTVADLADTLDLYCGTLGFELIGEIRHHDDERGFLMTYVQAGPAILEIFSFTEPTKPTGHLAMSRNGVRAVGFGVGSVGAAVAEIVKRGGDQLAADSVVDRDGVVLSFEVGAR
jgi:catechol 2,3-dioxygenase-like lactoylglutathione lyase family enzyme